MELNQERYQSRIGKLIPRKKRSKPMRFVFAGLIVMIVAILLAYLIMVKGLLKYLLIYVRTII